MPASVSAKARANRSVDHPDRVVGMDTGRIIPIGSSALPVPWLQEGSHLCVGWSSRASAKLA